MPNMLVFRPADAVETFECWVIALTEFDMPSCLVLSRQAVPAVRLEHESVNLCARGAYVLHEADGGEREVTLFATGSEVHIAVEARARLQADGIPTAVVSMPCWELFDIQPEKYRREVLGPSWPECVRVAVEAAISPGWDRYIGENGVFVGLQGLRPVGAGRGAVPALRHHRRERRRRRSRRRSPAAPTSSAAATAASAWTWSGRGASSGGDAPTAQHKRITGRLAPHPKRNERRLVRVRAGMRAPSRLRSVSQYSGCVSLAHPS